MFELFLALLIVLFVIYVYYNEATLKKGKIPFSSRIKNEEDKKNTIRKSAL